MKFRYLNPKNAEHESMPHTTDIMVFAKIVSEELQNAKTIHIIMEPGDATRYEFLIHPMTGKHEYVVSCVMAASWSCKVHNGGFPYEPHHFEVTTNPCTLKLIVDFMNLVAGHGLQGYYDFKAGRAT